VSVREKTIVDLIISAVISYAPIPLKEREEKEREKEGGEDKEVGK
jgi:hypothetical protein